MMERKKKPGAQPKFNEMDDKLLKRLVKKHGVHNWTVIANKFNYKSPKQCRDRWNNYLKPDFVHKKWSEEEDVLLLQKYNKFGPNWSQIQTFFPNRSPANVRNRYLKIQRVLSKVSHLISLNIPSEPDSSEDEKKPIEIAKDIVVKHETNEALICNPVVSDVFDKHETDIIDSVYGSYFIEQMWNVI